MPENDKDLCGKHIGLRLSEFDRLLIFTGGISCFIILLLFFQQNIVPSIHFRVSEIVSWVTVNKYSKQAEFINYFMFLTVPAAGGLLFYYLAALLCRNLSRNGDFFHIFALASLIWTAALPFACFFIVLPFKMIVFIFVFQVLMLAVFLLLSGVSGMRLVLIKPFDLSGIPVISGSEAESLSCKSFFSLPEHKGLRRTLTAVFYFAIVPGLLYWLLYDPDINKNIDMFHDGELLAPLSELLKGKVPYKDIYLQHGLFQNALIPFLGAGIFEPTLAGMRTMQHIIDPLPCVAMYFLCMVALRSGLLTSVLLAVIATSSRLWMIERQTFAFLSLTLLVLACSCCWWRTERTRKQYFAGLVLFGLSGFFAMMSFWHSVEIGIYALAGETAFIVAAFVLEKSLRNTWKACALSFFCGITAGFWTVGFYLMADGAFSSMLRNVYEQCAYQPDAWGRPFPSIHAELVKMLGAGSISSGIKNFLRSEALRFNLPVFVFMIAVSYLVYELVVKRKALTKRLALCLLFTFSAICFYRTALGRCGNTHLLYGSTVFWVLAFMLLETFSASFLRFVSFFTRNCKAAVSAFLIRTWNILPTLMLFLLVLGFSWEYRELIFSRLYSRKEFAGEKAFSGLQRIGKVILPESQEEQLRKVLKFINDNTKEDDSFFDFSSQGAYYFLLNKSNPTRFHQTAYACTPAMQKEAVEKLESCPPPFIIYQNGEFFDRIDGVPSCRRYPLIEKYIRKNYVLETSIGPTVIFKRIESKRQ